jgi:hypothetical protein
MFHINSPQNKASQMMKIQYTVNKCNRRTHKFSEHISQTFQGRHHLGYPMVL